MKYIRLNNFIIVNFFVFIISFCCFNVIYIQNSHAETASQAVSLVNIGISFYTKKNYVEARKYYEKAAILGDADGMYRLGDIYENGFGVDLDYKIALRWYVEASRRGSAEAMASVGAMISEGRGAHRDGSKAIRWLEAAALRGSSYAMNKMGQMYENGQHVSQNYSTAVRWYQAAVAQREPWAHVNLGLLFQAGYGVAEDDCKALDLYKDALLISPKMFEAMNNIGVMYHKGECVKRDLEIAKKYYKQSADLGNEIARANLQYLNSSKNNSYYAHKKESCDANCRDQISYQHQQEYIHRYSTPPPPPMPLPPSIYVRPISPFYGVGPN